MKAWRRIRATFTESSSVAPSRLHPAARTNAKRHQMHDREHPRVIEKP